MREILFRGECTETGDWVKGHYVRLFDDKGNRHHRIFPGYAESDCGDLYPDWYEVDPETVGQFTGLTDKNGTKVFEGDIIAFTCTDGTKHFSVVKYGAFNCSCCDGVYGWYLYGDCGDIRDLDPKGGMLRFVSVEGNIHDNPELLEKK